MKKKVNIKKLTDSELVHTYKNLNKIIKVVDGRTVVVEKVLQGLPKSVVDHINKDRGFHTNPFYIAGMYGDLTTELAERFIKQHG